MFLKGQDRMNIAYIYLQIYRLFDKITPIKADCGRLCGARCCKGDDSGMYLFPGEEKVIELLNPPWATLEKSEFTYEYLDKKKNVPILFCDGKCDRYQRPLACRIFPLTPYINSDGNTEIIIDPRAKSLCPLAKELKKDEFDYKFSKNVKKAFNLLSKNKEIKVFLKEYSKYIDEYRNFYED